MTEILAFDMLNRTEDFNYESIFRGVLVYLLVVSFLSKARDVS